MSSLSVQDRLFLGLQVVIALVTLAFFRFLPPPGWAVAVLAAAAVFISLQGMMQGWQKAFWMALICGLLLVELRSISADRAQSDKRASDDRDMQFREFQRIESGIAQIADRKATAIGIGSIESSQAKLIPVVPKREVQKSKLKKLDRASHQ